MIYVYLHACWVSGVGFWGWFLGVGHSGVGFGSMYATAASAAVLYSASAPSAVELRRRQALWDALPLCSDELRPFLPIHMDATCSDAPSAILGNHFGSSHLVKTVYAVASSSVNRKTIAW